MTKYYHSRLKRRQKASTRGLALFFLATGFLSLIVLGFLFLNPLDQDKSKEVKPSTEQAKTSQDNLDKEASNSQAIEWLVQDQPVKLPILMYHGVHVMAPSEASNANNIIDPALFEEHMKALKEAGYYSLTPEEAYQVLSENVLPNNQKVVWITFDDSISDFYTDAYPILNKYQMKATNNVITGFVDKEIPGSLTLSQILEMKDKGMSFQAHTVNHPSLADSSPEVQAYELSESKNYLDQALGQDTISIAYPSGRYTETTLSTAQSLSYQLGVTTNNGLASVSDGLLSLNRVRVLPTTTANHLLAEISY